MTNTVAWRSEQPELTVLRLSDSVLALAFEESRVDRGEERRRHGVALRAVPEAAARVADVQPVLCPGEPDEEEPALLVGVRRRAGEPQRQQPVLAADQKDHRELQALG